MISLSTLLLTGEALLIGNSANYKSFANYQIQATAIQIDWTEIQQVLQSDAHLHPTFLRDEVYDFAIEWHKNN